MKKVAKENLLQIKDLLQVIKTEHFTKKAEVLSGSSVGQHIRHILEFYLLLVSGSFSGTVSYDKRQRDKRIEQDQQFAIALAWPATYCKQAGAWYEPVTTFLGFNRNNYYKAGHAAVVLVDSKNRKCHYFDFGRYHAPFQFGRVRGAETDHEMALKTVPEISADGKRLKNLEVILAELQNNPACHGDGELHASRAPVNFEDAFSKAMHMQHKSPIAYGPFKTGGSNCSRFVNTLIRSGNPPLKHRLKLRFFVPLTPTPMNNVNALNGQTKMQSFILSEPFHPVIRLPKTALRSTLSAPVRHKNIPENAKWLAGEGAGSWFVLNFRGAFLEATRYSPKGIKECSGLFISGNNEFPLAPGTYEITYPSHCKEITLLAGKKKLVYKRASNGFQIPSAKSAKSVFAKKSEKIPKTK